MTDKVQKIKDWISKTQDGLMDAQGNFEHPEHEGAYYILCNLDTYIDSLKEEPKFKTGDRIKPVDSCLGAPRTILEVCDGWYVTNQGTLDFEFEDNWEAVEEPVSEDLEEAADKYSETIESYYPNDMFDRGSIYSAFKAGAKWQKEKDESTTEDLGEYINKLSKQFPEVSFAKLSRIAVRVAKWQREQMEKEYSNLNKGLATAKGLAVTMAYDKGMADAREQMMKNIWKPADGDELPEYDRGAIVLTQPYPLKGSEFAVSFAHRPNPNGWYVKRIITGQVEHYTPKTYDKGGWNIPDIKWWLDVKFPK